MAGGSIGLEDLRARVGKAIGSGSSLSAPWEWEHRLVLSSGYLYFNDTGGIRRLPIP